MQWDSGTNVFYPNFVPFDGPYSSCMGESSTKLMIPLDVNIILLEKRDVVDTYCCLLDMFP